MAIQAKLAAQAATPANLSEYGEIDAGKIAFPEIPGHPKPYGTDDPRLVGLQNSIKGKGIQTPILIDEKDQVWDGRSRALVGQILGIKVPYRRIRSEDGPAIADEALARHEWDIIDYADYIAHVGSRIPKIKGRSTKELVSDWLREHRGWVRGFQARSIQEYLNLAKKSDAEKERVRSAESIYEAMQMLEGNATIEGQQHINCDEDEAQEEDGAQEASDTTPSAPKPSDKRSDPVTKALQALTTLTTHLTELDRGRMSAEQLKTLIQSLSKAQEAIGEFLADG